MTATHLSVASLPTALLTLPSLPRLHITDGLDVVNSQKNDNPWVAESDEPDIRRILSRFETYSRDQLWFLVLMCQVSIPFDSAMETDETHHHRHHHHYHDDLETPMGSTDLTNLGNILVGAKITHTQLQVARFPLQRVHKINCTRKRRPASTASSADAESVDGAAISAKEETCKVWIHEIIIGPIDSESKGEQMRQEWMGGRRRLKERVDRAKELARKHDTLMWRNHVLNGVNDVITETEYYQ